MSAIVHGGRLRAVSQPLIIGDTMKKNELYEDHSNVERGARVEIKITQK